MMAIAVALSGLLVLAGVSSAAAYGYREPDLSRYPGNIPCRDLRFRPDDCSGRDAFAQFWSSISTPDYQKLTSANMSLFGPAAKKSRGHTRPDFVLEFAQANIIDYARMSRRGNWESPQGRGFRCMRNMLAWAAYNKIQMSMAAKGLADSVNMTQKGLRKAKKVWPAAKSAAAVHGMYAKIVTTTSKAAEKVAMSGISMDMITDECDQRTRGANYVAAPGGPAPGDPAGPGSETAPEPVAEPTGSATESPTTEPTAEPTTEPTTEPVDMPTTEPVDMPTDVPVEIPTEAPSETPAEPATETPGEAPSESATPSPEPPASRPAAAITPPAGAGRGELVGVGDLTDDGIDDLGIVWSGLANGAFWLYPGVRDGGYGEGTRIGTSWNTMREMVDVRSATGESATDVLAANRETGKLYRYAGRPGGLAERELIGHGGWNGMWGLVGLGITAPDNVWTDFAAVETATGKLWLYPGLESGFGARIQIGNNWNTMTELDGIQDPDGTGWDGILAVEKATGVLWLFPGSGESTLAPRRRVGTNWNTMRSLESPGDASGDGVADLLAIDKATGDLWLYPGTPGEEFGARVKVGSGLNS